MFKRNVPLKDYSRYQIGGPAAYFLEVSTKEELLKGLKPKYLVPEVLKYIRTNNLYKE